MEMSEGSLLEAIRGSSPTIAAPWLEREDPGALAMLFRIMGAEAASPYLRTLSKPLARRVVRQLRLSANADPAFVPSLLSLAYEDDALRADVDEPLSPTPFHFLAKADPSVVAPQLNNEHPQTVAMILTHLEPRAAATILERLDPPSLQVEVAARIAHTALTTPDAVAMVEDGLRRRMTPVVRAPTQVGGPGQRARLLGHVDRSAGAAILAQLRERDPETADEVLGFLLTFDAITRLDEAAMRRLLRDVDRADLPSALAGAPVELQERVLRGLPQRSARAVRQAVDRQGPVDPAVVEEARRRIVGVVKRLLGSDEIALGDDGA